MFVFFILVGPGFMYANRADGLFIGQVVEGEELFAKIVAAQEDAGFIKAFVGLPTSHFAHGGDGGVGEKVGQIAFHPWAQEEA